MMFPCPWLKMNDWNISLSKNVEDNVNVWSIEVLISLFINGVQENVNRCINSKPSPLFLKFPGKDAVNYCVCPALTSHFSGLLACAVLHVVKARALALPPNGEWFRLFVARTITALITAQTLILADTCTSILKGALGWSPRRASLLVKAADLKSRVGGDGAADMGNFRTPRRTIILWHSHKSDLWRTFMLCLWLGSNYLMKITHECFLGFFEQTRSQQYTYKYILCMPYISRYKEKDSVNGECWPILLMDIYIMSFRDPYRHSILRWHIA